MWILIKNKERKSVELDTLIAWKDQLVIKHFPQLLDNETLDLTNIFQHLCRKLADQKRSEALD